VLLRCPIGCPRVQNLLITTFYYAYLAQAWNILGGYAGQLSLGHAAFFSIGAYTSAVLAIHWGISPWLGMFVGAVLAMLLSLGNRLPGLPLRPAGVLFVLLTVASAEICRLIALHLPILGGLHGPIHQLHSESAPVSIPGQDSVLLRFAWISDCCLLGGVVDPAVQARRISPRDSRRRGRLRGPGGSITFRYKMVAYAVSAALTAFGGTFYAYYQFYLQPNTVLTMNHSVDIMIRAIVGGTGTILGPILGSFLLELPRGILSDILCGRRGGAQRRDVRRAPHRRRAVPAPGRLSRHGRLVRRATGKRA